MLHHTKKTYNGRPRLSLPGFRATPGTEGQPASLPLPLAPVNRRHGTLQRDHGSHEPQTAMQSALEPRLSLRPREHASALHFLAIALGVGADALPGIFSGCVPLPLKIGIDADLRERFPTANPTALGRWLKYWTGTDAYLAAVAAGGNRFGIDGEVAGEIAETDVEHARERLARKKKTPAAG
jgi:hypothetical protein